MLLCRMAQPPAAYAETWNVEVDLLDRGIVETPESSFDFANFPNDDKSVRQLREYGQQLAARAEAEDARIGESLSSLDSLVRSRFCLSDYRQQEIVTHRARLAKLREQQDGDAALINQLQREQASLRNRLTTYEEDDVQRVQMEEELRRAKREQDERERQRRNKLQQALDIANGGSSSPSVAELRNRFDSPVNSPAMMRKQPEVPRTAQVPRRNENGPGFYNPKYRRSQSAPRVIDHRSAINIPTGTILKPRMPANAKATLAPKADLLRNSDGYILTHQQVDDEGNVATSIIKGDCIPTAGGGTAVRFNDIEHLSHEAPDQPTTEKRRKHRSSKKVVRF